jgi:hypothetical protein
MLYCPSAAMLAGEVITATPFIGGALGLFDVWLGAVSDAPQAAALDAVSVTDKVSN